MLIFSFFGWIDCRDRADRGKLNDIIQRCPNGAIASQLTAILEDTRSF
jgi:uncharacterized Fe-S cluster protein YjdI